MMLMGPFQLELFYDSMNLKSAFHEDPIPSYRIFFPFPETEERLGEN